MKNQAAIEALEVRVVGLESQSAEIERKGNALIEIINEMRAEDGLPPRPPFGGGGSGKTSQSSASVTAIKPDTFYGKKLQTAVREYLEMRYVAARGTDPATPKEIYEAITKGGFQFEAKTDEIAMVGLRALLRKRTAFFHKLPNGTYGLTSWYPDAKKPKAGSVADVDASDDEDDNVITVDTKGTATAKAAAAS
jgi:hypothetical protein